MGPEEQDGLETSELGAERGQGAPQHGHSHHCLGLCFTHPEGDEPPRAGPSTSAWLMGQPGSGASWGGHGLEQGVQKLTHSSGEQKCCPHSGNSTPAPAPGRLLLGAPTHHL